MKNMQTYTTENKMALSTAFGIIRGINSEGEALNFLSSDVVLQAIDTLLHAETINSITKQNLKNTLMWCMRNINELQEKMTNAEATEKQIPKKPFEDPVDIICPSCLATLYRKASVRTHKHDRFCRECGQRIDWSDEE